MVYPMTDANDPELQAEIAGLLLAQYVLLEALVRHDALPYHQVRETLSDALGTLTATGEVGEPVLRPLHRLLDTLDQTHKPATLKAGRPHLDWLQVFERCSAE